MIRFASALFLTVSFSQASIADDVVAVGSLNSEMSFEEIVAILGPPETEYCTGDERVVGLCSKVFRLPDEFVEVMKDIENRTVSIRRVISVPDDLNQDDVFGQLRDKYGHIGVENIDDLSSITAIRFGCWSACDWDDYIVRGFLKVQNDQIMGPGVKLTVAYHNGPLFDETEQRMLREIEANKPKLPL